MIQALKKSYLVLQVCFTLFNLQGTRSVAFRAASEEALVDNGFILAQPGDLVKYFFQIFFGQSVAIASAVPVL